MSDNMDNKSSVTGSLDNGAQRLTAVLDIARAIARQGSAAEMLSRFLFCLVRTLNLAGSGIVLLYDPNDRLLHVEAALGYDLAALKRLRLAPGESMAGRSFETGALELYATPEAAASAMANLSPENREIFQTAAIESKQPLSALSLPMISEGTKVGVLVLENVREPEHFRERNMPFLQALTDLMALAIESALSKETLQASQAIAEANRLKAEVISVLAHEMRTPLTSIKGYSTALLMDEISFSPETQREFLQIIDEECDVLQDLIRDLLETSTIDAGLLKLEIQPVLLPKLTQEVVEEIVHRSPKHSILIDFPERFPIVEADPSRVSQVLRNLLDNAIKYSPQGGLIVVRGEVKPTEVLVSVADQGVGIAPEDLNRLFERFFRAKGFGRHIVGSGLGLPIARAIVESHGGRIWAESQVGQGSTFYFTLPMKQPATGMENGK